MQEQSVKTKGKRLAEKDRDSSKITNGIFEELDSPSVELCGFAEESRNIPESVTVS